MADHHAIDGSSMKITQGGEAARLGGDTPGRREVRDWPRGKLPQDPSNCSRAFGLTPARQAGAVGHSCAPVTPTTS